MTPNKKAYVDSEIESTTIVGNNQNNAFYGNIPLDLGSVQVNIDRTFPLQLTTKRNVKYKINNDEIQILNSDELLGNRDEDGFKFDSIRTQKLETYTLPTKKYVDDLISNNREGILRTNDDNE